MSKKKNVPEKKVFVDLEHYAEPMYVRSEAGIKIVTVTSRRDTKPISDMIYRGNVMILDFSKFTEGDAAKTEMAERLREASDGMRGAFTVTSDRLMVSSPAGLSIEKCKILYREK